MISTFKKIPFYLLLLPLFFVLRGYSENFNHIPIGDALMLFLAYALAISVTALFLFIFIRNVRKVALITFSIFSCYFFFGSMQDFLQKNSTLENLSRYRVMLPAIILIVLITLVFSIRTKSKLLKLTFFLNVLFTIYISIDLFGVTAKAISGPGQKLVMPGKTRTSPCHDCPKPNIYFMLFDSYASSVSLKERFNFINPLDNFLVKKGFRIQMNSRSNYNLTPFSMASILNMSYVENLQHPLQLKPADYLACNLAIRNNGVIGFLEASGYDIINHSFFDLKGEPTKAKKSFLPLKTNMITEHTLYARVERDMGEWLLQRAPFKYFRKLPWQAFEDNNLLFLNQTLQTARQKSSRPKFVYTHVYIPHRPYFFDRHGRRKADSTIVKEFFEMNIDGYLNYMLYGNSHIEKIINTIQQHDPAAIIIFMGDHGHRVKSGESFPRHFFSNMNAVYYPDGDYGLLYDSISGVNQFRVVFNKWFRQSLPLLKDSMTFVEPAKNYLR